MQTIRPVVFLLLSGVICTCALAVTLTLTIKYTGGPGEHVYMLAVQNRIFVAYNPQGHSEVVFLCSDDGGESFKLTGRTGRIEGFGGSSLGLYQGHVYLAFHGGNRDVHINVVPVTLDGNGCPNNVDLAHKMESPISTDAPPILLGTTNKLLIAWMNRGNAAVNIAKVNLP